MSTFPTGITEETLDAIRKAQTNGITTGTGLVGFDLSGPVSLVPVITPWYDRVKRTQGDGARGATWRALLNINNAQPNPFVGLDQGGNYVKLSEIDAYAPYVPVRVSGGVTRDAIDIAKGYTDPKATAVAQTLMQWRIQEDKGLLGGQAFALPAIGAPTVLAGAAGTGTIASGAAVNVKVAARSAYNYYWGGSGIASAQGSVTTSTVAGGTYSATASVTAVRGAVAYDWYVAGFYYTTTTVNTVLITAIPTANAGSVPVLPDLYSTAPTAVPTADTSFSTSSYNGLIATLAGDYATNGTGLVTFGSGTPSGATFISLDGAKLTGNGQGVAEIDSMLLAIWNQAQLSPTAILMNGQESQSLKSKILSTNAAVTYLMPDGSFRGDVVAGGYIGSYVNGAAGGQQIPTIVDPHLPPGEILFITETIPYPNAGIANTFEARTLRDVSEFDYGVQLDTTPGNNGGPREVWDVSSTETFVNRAPVTCGVLSNIAAG